MADTLSNIVMRSARVQYGATTALGSDWGHVKDVKIKLSPAVAEKDNAGNTIVPGYKVEGSFRVMENDRTSLLALFTHVSTGTPYYYGFVDRNVSTNFFKTTIKVLPYIDTEIDMNGKADGILCKFAYFIDQSNMENLL